MAQIGKAEKAYLSLTQSNILTNWISRTRIQRGMHGCNLEDILLTDSFFTVVR